MTQDEIIEMALEEWRSGDQVKQAGLDRNYTNLFKAFAKLVAAKERANNALLCYEQRKNWDALACADAIRAGTRARGEA